MAQDPPSTRRHPPCTNPAPAASYPAPTAFKTLDAGEQVIQQSAARPVQQRAAALRPPLPSLTPSLGRTVIVDDEGVSSARLTEVREVLHQVGQVQVHAEDADEVVHVVARLSNAHHQVWGVGGGGGVSLTGRAYLEVHGASNCNTRPDARSSVAGCVDG